MTVVCPDCNGAGAFDVERDGHGRRRPETTPVAWDIRNGVRHLVAGLLCKRCEGEGVLP